jgi:CRISPR-associated Cas5-like protein
MPTTYPFAVEVAAELGMFASPDTGSEPCSYLVPPQSAAKGIIESICRLKAAKIEPVAVGICFTPKWERYAFNSFSPIRKNDQINRDLACQIRATVLVHPRYVILGLITTIREQVPVELSRINHAHSAQAQLARRLRQGRFFSAPVMGWKDFPVHTCTVPKTPITQYNSILPTFATTSFYNGGVEMKFKQNMPIENGVLRYTDEPVMLDKEGKLTFASVVLRTQLSDFVGEAQ